MTLFSPKNGKRQYKEIDHKILRTRVAQNLRFKGQLPILPLNFLKKKKAGWGEMNNKKVTSVVVTNDKTRKILDRRCWTNSYYYNFKVIIATVCRNMIFTELPSGICTPRRKCSRLAIYLGTPAQEQKQTAPGVLSHSLNSSGIISQANLLNWPLIWILHKMISYVHRAVRFLPSTQMGNQLFGG